jgi:hypothetical protein
MRGLQKGCKLPKKQSGTRNLVFFVPLCFLNILVGAEGLEPTNLTDVNRAL